MKKVKRLRKSRKESMIFGIAGGVGEYFGIDATVVRILFVCATVAFGGGILVYLILFFVIPPTPFISKDGGMEFSELGS